MADTRIVARRAGIVALGTLASRVLGMLREAVVAACFSVGATDAFFIAFTIPNTLRMLLGEGAVSNAFIPVFTDVRTQRGQQAARDFLARFSAALGVLLALTSAAGMLLARPIAVAYAGGFISDPERFELVVWLTRWLFPFLGLAGLAALATGALNAVGHFAVAAFAPALLNVAMIAAPFTLLSLTSAWDLEPITSLALGALLGGVLQLVVQLVPLRGVDLLPRPVLDFRAPDVRRALGLMGPLVLGLGVYQLNMLLSRLFASFLPAGAQSFLNYGQRVIEIPQGMFALAVASAALPTLARLHSEGKRAELLALFRDSIRLTMFVAIPASAFLIALAAPTTSVLFERGLFGPEQVAETAHSLAWQAAGVWAVAAVRATVPMFAAHGDTRTPVKASAVNLVVFLSLSALLMGRLSHVALALANSAAALVQLVVLLWLLRRHTGPMGLAPVIASGLRVALASTTAGVALWLAASRLSFGPGEGEIVRLGAYGALLAAGAVIFLVVAWLLRAPELSELKAVLMRRRRRAAL
ncbi:MAG: murein biosynthesis integral membrane protein MurJ [Myxococcales bacterium]